MVKLPVSEIFYSIEGEGSRTGLPAVFIRLFGCNLRCSYCDSAYACDAQKGDFTHKTVDEIIDIVKEYDPCPCVTITGGEPLVIPGVIELVDALRAQNFWVNIETNGSIDLAEFKRNLAEPQLKSAMDYFLTMDWKSISSGESGQMIESNLGVLTMNDVLKFVVADEDDLNQMKTLLTDHALDLECQVYVSPVWGKISPARLVEYILDNDLTFVKVQVQLHKIIWDPEKRGV